MWTCIKCQMRLENDFDTCWSCGTSRAGVADPEFAPEDVAPRVPQPRELDCLRCGRELDFMGGRNFHEGARWGFIGTLGELFVNRESFDVYACPGCGHVEFFVSGVGE